MTELLDEAYRDRLDAELREWKARAEQARARGARLKAEGEIEGARLSERFSERYDELKEKYEELKESGSDEWENVKETFSRTLDELRESWERLSEEVSA
jgi:hypothetical protein